MDIYFLDAELKETFVFDDYKSLVWTERFSEAGDFELVVPYTKKIRDELWNGRMLSIPEKSFYVMIIETIEIVSDSETGSEIKVKGRSLESLLKTRALVPPTSPPLKNNPRYMVGTPQELVMQRFELSAGINAVVAKDMLPMYFGINFSPYPPGNMPWPVEIIGIEEKPQSLYDFIESLAKDFEFGFRILYVPGSSDLVVEVYVGNDRTQRQSDFPPLIFSKEFSTIDKVNSIESVSDYANVAYVYGPTGTVVVFQNGYYDVDFEVSGWQRKVVSVDASGATVPPGMTMLQVLRSMGYEALKKHNAKIAIDGEVPKILVYNVDYALGDRVEFHDEYGNISEATVTEQIFSFDENGERSFPSFGNTTMVTRGSWLSVPKDVTWSSVGDVAWSEYDLVGEISPVFSNILKTTPGTWLGTPDYLTWSDVDDVPWSEYYT